MVSLSVQSNKLQTVYKFIASHCHLEVQYMCIEICEAWKFWLLIEAWRNSHRQVIQWLLPLNTAWCTDHFSHLTTKPTKWPMRRAKIQISLGIHPVWSESSLSAWRNIGPLTIYWAHRSFGMCTGISNDKWSESSLGAQSFCWFCHEAAHFIFQKFWR